MNRLADTTFSPQVTFAVDDVAPAIRPLPKCKAYEAVKQTLDTEIESCFDYHGSLIRDVEYQPLLAAVYIAFSQHRPLVLTPDAVWITIVQGVAHHMAIHGEDLRHRFVKHQGKVELVFETRDWIEGTPENPWHEAFESWAGQISDHVGSAVHDLLVCDFTTSGPVERSVSQIVMMDVFNRYFHYVLHCVCGIPTVTLRGAPSDWRRLRDKAAGLKIYDMDWWLKHLLPICDQFILASEGNPDLDHWRNICKLRKEYGGDVINGWIAKLFPYLLAHIDGPCNRKNPIFDSGEGFQTLLAPSGLSRVPFTWRNFRTMRERQMEVIGGLVGVSQDPQTLALCPKAGWAIRQADKMEDLLSRLVREHVTYDGAEISARRFLVENYLPPDLAKFYHRTNGAELTREGEPGTVRIVQLDQIVELNWDKSLNQRVPRWHRIADLPDGAWLAINLSPCRPASSSPSSQPRDENFNPLCHCTAATLGRPGWNPVVALSFEEFLERMLDAGGKPYWFAEAFIGYGDAELYTYRK